MYRKIVRQSNIELLRIVCMFLIFVNHMNGHGVMGDNVASLDYSLKSIVFIIATSVVVCAAPVFVIISGYFGIKPTLMGGEIQCYMLVLLCFVLSFFYDYRWRDSFVKRFYKLSDIYIC